MTEKVNIGNAELWHGDCREVLPGIVADSCITDPPYGIALANHARGSSKHRRAAAYTVAGDECQTVGIHVLDWARGVDLPTLFFASPRRPWPGEWRNWLVWDKGGAVGGGGDVRLCWKQTWELIQISGNGPLHGSRDEAIIRWAMRPTDSALHPCEKPVGLMIYLISKLGVQNPVDPFMGTGATGSACANLGLPFTGIEMDRRYFDIAVERISRAQSQARLFPDEPAPIPQQMEL